MDYDAAYGGGMNDLQQQQQQQQQGGATTGGGPSGAMDDDSVESLIPLCVRHPDGPQLNSAVYGYDIQHMQDKPWTKPGANLSDYFNYGFDEVSYRAYCALQPKGKDSIRIKADEYLKSVFGGAPSGAMHSGGGGGGGSYGQQGGGGHQDGGGFRKPGFKTRICYGFREGNCPRGDACFFAHGEEEMRKYQDLDRMNNQGGGGGGGGGYSRQPYNNNNYNQNTNFGPPASGAAPGQPGGPPAIPSHQGFNGGSGNQQQQPQGEALMPAPPQGGGSSGFRMPPRHATASEGLFEEPDLKRSRYQ